MAALALAIGFLATNMLAGPRGVGAASGDLNFVAGNPTCQSLGYTLGFKLEPQGVPEEKEYTDGKLTVEISNVSADGKSFDWESNILIDAVIVKGGAGGSGGEAGANVYTYPDGSMGDTGLVSPNNTAISHIEFCYSPRLDVTKTADPSFTRTHTWEIDKSVAPGTLNLFEGDSADVEYTVEVTKTTVDSGYAVSGTITIHNPGPGSATITGVSDQLSNGTVADVVCPGGTSQTLLAGATLVCTYSADLTSNASLTNTATVSVASNSAVKGGSGVANVDFSRENPNVVGHDVINVTDTNGDKWTFTDSDSVSYTKTFNCDDVTFDRMGFATYTHDNTVTIDETSDYDTETVTVNCYQLKVVKNARTSFDRDWEWDIEKTGDVTELTLSPGQTHSVGYEVTVSATKTDSDHVVTGRIHVQNLAPMNATINSVSDLISPDIQAEVFNCNRDLPFSLPYNWTLVCDYRAELPNADTRTNTATAVLQNYHYDAEGNATETVETNFTGTAQVSFANATMTETDECITLDDDKYGSLGIVCADGSPYSRTFDYTLDVGPYAECGDYEFENTATFVTNDSETEGSDNHVIDVNVPCPTCTLTQGYWKTHSQEGPAPYDNAWQNLGPLEEDTIFFRSGETWHQVFWTAPAGNVYYNLAHQYMAAKLNVLNDAGTTPEVTAAILRAEQIFTANTPDQIKALKANNALRKEIIELAGILASYNEGLTGPGHCDE